MEASYLDNDDQASVSESSSSDRTPEYDESPKKYQEDRVIDSTIQESQIKDHQVTSEYLSELPSFVKAKMAIGKRLYSGCVCKHHRDVTVYLLDADLWRRFSAQGTEMVITKKGRRVFPVPSYAFCDLDPEKLYNITLEITAMDNAIYKFSNSEWVVSKDSSQSYPTPPPGRSTYMHPFSPNTGLHWMKEPITFSGLKISNNLDASETIVLHSMRKYVMNLIISEMNGSWTATIFQPETVFVAVTQYQNEKVTQMKIEHNPFANGFRFTATRRERPKRQFSHEADYENESKLDNTSSSELSPLPSPQTPSFPNRTENEPTDTQKLVSYLEQKRQMFNKLLPAYFDELKTQPDQSMNAFGLMGSWPPALMPPGNTMYSLYDNPNDFTVNPSNYMFPMGEANPLAFVRQFGEFHRCSDTDVPLSLVKKKRKTENKTKTEECSRKTAGTQYKSLIETRHSTPGNRQFKKKCKFPNGQEFENEMEVQSVGQKTAAPALDSGFACRTNGLHENKKAVNYEDVTCQGKADVAKEQHPEYMPDGLPPATTVSCLGHTEMENTLHLNHDTFTDLGSPGNQRSANLKAKSGTQMVTQPEVTLKNGDLWATTHEVVISSEGRLMFPFISLSVDKLCPDRYYHIILKLAPNSPWIYNYKDHEWVPSIEATARQIRTCHPHPENSKSGSQWGADVTFDRLRLSTLKQGKNMLKVQLRRQYLPVVIIQTENQSWEYPLKNATFVTVKIDRSPYQLSRSMVGYPPFPKESERISNRSCSLMELVNRNQMYNKMRPTDTPASDPDQLWTLMNLPTQSSPLNLNTRDFSGASTSMVQKFPSTAWTHPSSSSSVMPAVSLSPALDLMKLYKSRGCNNSEPVIDGDSRHCNPATPSTSLSTNAIPTLHVDREIDGLTGNVQTESSASSLLDPKVKSQPKPAVDTLVDC